MGFYDDLRQGVRDTANKFRPAGIAAGPVQQATAAAPAAPAEAPPARGYPGVKPLDPARATAMFNATDAMSKVAGEEAARTHVNTAMDRKAPGWLDRSNTALDRVEAAKTTANEARAALGATGGAPPPNQPPGTVAAGGTPETPKPGIGGRIAALPGMQPVMKYGGLALKGAGVVGGAVGAANAGADIVNNGANVDNTTSLAGNVVMGVAPFSPVGVGAGAFLAGKELGKRFMPDDTAIALAEGFNKLNPFADANANRTTGTLALTPEFQKTVDAAGGAEKYVSGIRGQAAGPATAAPVAAPVLPPVQTFAPGTAEAKNIRAEVEGTGVPAAGTGMIVNNSTGRAMRINAPAPAPAAAPDETAGMDPVEKLLFKRAQGLAKGDNRASANAFAATMQVLGNYRDNKERNDLARETNTASARRHADERSDQIVENFDKKLTANTYFKQDGENKGKPDEEKNARFAMYFREKNPQWATREGMVEFDKLSGPKRLKLLAEAKAGFDDVVHMEGIANNSMFSSKNRGTGNKDIEIGTPKIDAQGNVTGYNPTGAIKKSGLGDILANTGRGHLGFRPIWEGLNPVGSGNIVETSEGPMWADEVIGDQKLPNSAARRTRINELKQVQGRN